MHHRTVKYKKGEERKRRHLAVQEERAVTSRAFSAYGHPLEIVKSFRHLGKVILAAENNWTAVVRNLEKVRAVWKRMTRIFSREETEPWMYSFFFKYVVQAILIFGSETWVVSPCMRRVSGGLQEQVARSLTGRLPRRKKTGSGSTP